VHSASKLSETACATVILVHDVGLKRDPMLLLTGRIACHLTEAVYD
jgi:hypothetical protein